MRFPEQKIKEAVLNRDPEIRLRALSYFASSFSSDPSVMGLVIQAVETYGREDAFDMLGPSRDLRQTEQSIAWVIDELNNEQNGTDDLYISDLSRILLQADPELLLPKETAILEARHFPAALRFAFTERLRMLSWDEPTLWRKLEESCDLEAEESQETDQFWEGRSRQIAEALSRHGKAVEGKVLGRLAQKVEDSDPDRTIWMDPVLVRVAGLARFESAIPSIVARLFDDIDDHLNEECSQALIRIGTPAVLHAVAEVFPGTNFDLRVYLCESLENIHSDLAVETCVELLEQVKEPDTQRLLVEALLWQFSSEGIEVARQLIMDREPDFLYRGLRKYLLQTCAITGERLPEHDAWLAAQAAEAQEHAKGLEELAGDPAGQLLFSLEKLTGKKTVDVLASSPSPPLHPRPSPPGTPEVRPRAGRNDPCPCGSGKKFKKCCGRS